MKFLALAIVLSMSLCLSAQTANQPAIAPENLPNIGLLFAGVAGIVVAVRTLRAIQNQVEQMIESGKQTEAIIQHAGSQVEAMMAIASATQANSEAVLLTVRAQKVAERAHVDIDCAPIPDRGSIHHFTATNYGKSHAMISVYSFGRYRVAAKPNQQMPDTLAEMGTGIQERNAANQMLPVGQIVPIFEFDPTHYLSEEHRSGKEWAFFGCSITYKDIFGEDHETEVVYSFRPSLGSLKNEPRYNRYT